MSLLRLRPIVNYGDQQDAITSFLEYFKSTTASDALGSLSLDETENELQKTVEHLPKYLSMMKDVADRNSDHIFISLDDVSSWEETEISNMGVNSNLTSSIEKNTDRYVELFSRAVDKLMPQGEALSFKDDVIDIIISQRMRRNERMQEEAESNGQNASSADIFPPELTRRYTLSFLPRYGEKSLSVRQVKADQIGQLVIVRGIATRVSDVKAAVVVNAYSCERCGFEIFQPVVGRKFMPLESCPSEECKKAGGGGGPLFHSTRGSRFVPFQEVRMQEISEQVPVGHIPRAITIHVRGGLVRQVGPGDVVDISGVFLPTPYTGFAAMKAGLLTDTYVEAHHIRQHKQPYASLQLSSHTLARMESLQRDGQLYEALARSIAPEIFGHHDVKKALLLQLIGGVTKEIGDGMKIRGDINICLVGDPGVAKSQLLKFIAKTAPRGIYTTGRGSSGVGLTAAVMRDPVTDEMVLEGGALVLADNGTCCIDEFDKMADSDRTAIHEVMEQQTISIAKAGITTSLNARTSILAAANPLMGRYDLRISVAENVNLPPALLSRFDVLFLLLDKPDRSADEELARHVTSVHMGMHPSSASLLPPNSAAAAAAAAAASHPDTAPTFSPSEIREWVARARSFRPVIPVNVSEYCVGAYVRMRANHKQAVINSANGNGPSNSAAVSASSSPTPRALLAVLRLSQSLARLRFASEVVLDDVDEALRLVSAGAASLLPTSDTDRMLDHTPVSRIYTLIRSFAADEVGVGMDDGYNGRRGGGTDFDPDDGRLDMARLRERVIARGFTDDQFRDTVREYQDLNVWLVSSDGRSLEFLDRVADV